MLLVSFTACQQTGRQIDSSDNSESPSPGDQVIGLALPIANALMFVDPTSGDTSLLPPIPLKKVHTLSSLVDLGDTLAVSGTGSDRISLIDESSGEVLESRRILPRRFRAFVEAVWYVTRSVNDELIAIADGAEVGLVVAFDPSTLEYLGHSTIGPGQNGFAWDGQGRLWTLGVDGAPTFSVTDIARMHSRTRRLGGYPNGIAADPSGHMHVTLRDKSEVASLSLETLKVEGRIDVPGQPWGIDIAPDGRGAVVAQGAAPPFSGSLHIIDFRRERLLATVPLSNRCPDARDVLLLDSVAIVVCAGLPGVAIVDLDELRITTIMRVPVSRGSEQPRHPVLVNLHGET